MDVLFVHVPKFSNYYKPIDKFSFIHLPPMGLLGLADYVRKNGCSAKIIHLGVEREKYGTINLDKIIADYQPAIIGLDLHWHFQSFNVIEVAKKIKRAAPNIGVLLGGFTASYFADEILRNFECVDFVIRGDAEIPLLDLVTQHHSDKAYYKVPNLSYREGESIHVNPINYVADEAILDGISFTDFSLMKDYSIFVESFSTYMKIDGLSLESQKALTKWKKSYPVFLGRGCECECSYCGGSKEAQRIINNRRGLYIRSVNSVLESLLDLQKYGFEFAHIAWAPFPREEEFFFTLLDGIERLKISLGIEIERYRLPTRHFIQRVRKSLNKGSYITLSPNSHNEEIRRKNGLYQYSNKDLEECLGYMDEEGVNCGLYFTCGLPFEREDHLKEMALYQKKLRKKFKHVKCKTSMIEIEPGSEMSRNPSAYGVTSHRETFLDYYKYHSQPFRNHFLEMGYDRTGCPGQDKMTRLFCRHFCSHFRTGQIPPLLCKVLCSASSVLWKMGIFRAVDKIFMATRRTKGN